MSVDLTSKPLMPIASHFVSSAARKNIVDRLLDAEIYYLVAVIGEDNIDQILADVVNVALDGREHQNALVRALDLFHKRFEEFHRRLHRLRRLQHERQLHLPAAEQIADRFHSVEQNVVDDLERRIFFEGDL